ncbi:MAG: ATP-binding protein [Bacteroidota bacterium]
MRILIRLLILFSFISLTLLVLKLRPEAEEAAYNRIQENFNEQLEVLEADLLNFMEQFEILTNPFKIQSSKDFLKRVYVDGSMIYWSDNRSIPGYGTLKENDTLYSIQSESGIYVVRREVIPTNTALVEIFSIIPLQLTPPISNEYLSQTSNSAIFGNNSILFFEADHELTHNNESIVSYEIISETSNFGDKWFPVSLLISLVLGLLVIYFYFGKDQANHRKLILALVLILIFRLVVYVMTGLFYPHWQIFNPIYFSESRINYTLGDLFFNSLTALLMLAVFFRLSKWLRFGLLGRRNKWIDGFVLIFISFIVLADGFILYRIPWIILEHSQIELDISQSISFDYMRLISSLILVINALSFITIFTICQKVFQFIKQPMLFKATSYLIAVGILYLALGNIVFVVVGIISIVWVIINATYLSFQLFNPRYETFLFLVLMLSLSASLFSYGVYKHFERDRQISKEKYADKLLIPNDILGEYYLSQIMGDIEEDTYIQSRLLNRLVAKQNIREKITRQFLSTYFKKYDVEVYLFGADGASYDSPNSRSYFDWRREYQKSEYLTDYSQLFLIEDETDNIRNQYLCFLSIEGFDQHVGYIILQLTLKKNIPTSVFPELLVESKYYLSTDQEEFDYAIYRKNSALPIYKQGRSGFESNLSFNDLQNPELYERGIEIGDVHYYGFKTNDDRLIVIASEAYDHLYLFSNFSFQLLVLLIICGFIFIVFRVNRTGAHLNLSTKIQLYLGMAFIFPMFVVSIGLLNTLNATYRDEIDQNFLTRSFTLAGNLVDITQDFENNTINRDDYSNAIAEAASLVQSDINIYETSGLLLSSSQMEIFNSGILGKQIKPEAYYAIIYNNEQSIILDEEIGKLTFRSSYSALRSDRTGNLLGILSMPYFESAAQLQNQQIQIFTNLISVFTLIFLISLFSGNLIVSQLVSPLKQIADRIRRTSLQEKNQPIDYVVNDEIGSLVNEYNQMLIKLEESKIALAESQKESAWKEIARQVAHEIKNPLTPMRLKIQQMMRSMNLEDHNYKSCISLVEQIDSLSDIADSFSAFAKMPVPKNEEFELDDLVLNTAELYQSDQTVLSLNLPDTPLKVYADPKIFSGILNNIILNGIQSVQEGKPVIKITLEKKGSKALLSIEDNGSGIPVEVQEKVFTPYFSTKRTGSGIGLAVAKKGIENAGGNIWFETEEGQGTTFNISLPLVV